MSKYFPIYFGEKLNKEEIMEMMGVEFERKIREIFEASEVTELKLFFFFRILNKVFSINDQKKNISDIVFILFI